MGIKYEVDQKKGFILPPHTEQKDGLLGCLKCTLD